jgi:uncharacterized membrane protein
MNFIKTTIIGGLVFMVPIVIVVAIVGKAFRIMRTVAAPLKAYIPTGNIGGIAVANLLVMLAIVLVCFIAGLIAKSGVSKRMYRSLDATLLAIPGYAFIKGFTDSMSSTEEAAESFLPVLVRFDDNAQIAFEVERTGDNVVVYLPGAPNPWSGSVAYFNVERVKRLEMSVSQTVKSLQKIGRGSAGYGELEL